MKKRMICFLVVFVVLVMIAIVGGSCYMLSFALSRTGEPKGNALDRVALREKEYPEIKPWIDSLQCAHALRDTFIVQADGTKAHALYVWAPRKTNQTAILVHGYKDRAEGMLHLGYVYHHFLGYNILLPDLHAHGRSEGSDIQMGWKDRIDVLRWTQVADRLFADSTGHTRQVLHGVSMGAATVMCVSGEKTPGYVKCFVEDCGYTSAWDEFQYELNEMFGLPPFPLMWTTSALCKLRYGWSFGQASPLRQVAKCHKPMLFIHGDKDDFVPTKMVYPLYQAKPGVKELFIGKGSIHAKTYRDHRKEYVRIVKDFVGRYNPSC